MHAVLAVKSPAHAKSRLAGVLNAAQRERLHYALAERAIRALRATRGIDAVFVATASEDIARFARALGAEPLRQAGEHGTAAAFAAAAQALRARDLPALLMLAADLPLISPEALARLVAAAPAAPRVLVVPDRHRSGTNALLCAPPQAIAPCFGPDSFRRHLAAAEAAGLPARVLDDAALALDLDTPDDLAALRGHDPADPSLPPMPLAAARVPARPAA
ncbi:MAG: 2-phospho-L-lactate guanylyltransferase [Solimonas sp.]